MMQKADMSRARTAALQCPEQRGVPDGGRWKWGLMACYRALQGPQHQRRYAVCQHPVSHCCAGSASHQAAHHNRAANWSEIHQDILSQ